MYIQTHLRPLARRSTIYDLNKRVLSRVGLGLLILLMITMQRASADTVAETSNFAANANKVPTSARTKFFLPIWTNGDATRTAHHELLHAIGFAVAYDKFKLHVDSSRNFRETESASGTILAKLTPANQGTHIDPNAGTVNGHDQSKSVMGPDRVTGQRMGAQEKSVQNAAFDWSSRNLSVTVNYVGSWNSTQKSYIEDAVSSSKSLFSSNGTGHSFTWTVEMANSIVSSQIQNSSSLSVSNLVAQIASGPASQRTQAMAEVLSRGVAIVPELLSAGAQPMSGLSPRRIDVLYSILSGHREGRYRTSSFGLQVEPETTRQEIVAMGERHGFVLPDDQLIDPANSPCCYVMLRQGDDLWDVLGRILSTEAKVTTVNLNYVEP